MKKITRRTLAGIAGGATALTAADYTRAYKKPDQFRIESGFPVETARWHCPELCGCTLMITAEWPAEAIGKNGDSFQHPRPGTIAQIHINTVCPAHKFALEAPIDEKPYGWYPGPIPLTPMKRMSATPAEKLYIYLYRYHGNNQQTKRGSDGNFCGCTDYCVAIVFDGPHLNERIIHHPLYTRVCPEHSKKEIT